MKRDGNLWKQRPLAAYERLLKALMEALDKLEKRLEKLCA